MYFIYDFIINIYIRTLPLGLQRGGGLKNAKWCKLVLITNRKSHYIGFRLVSKSVTLNDLGRRNSPYFALFHRVR